MKNKDADDAATGLFDHVQKRRVAVRAEDLECLQHHGNG